MDKDPTKAALIEAFPDVGITEAGIADGEVFFVWFAGADTICLDGDFTAAQLRVLADYMEAHR